MKTLKQIEAEVKQNFEQEEKKIEEAKVLAQSNPMELLKRIASGQFDFLTKEC